MIQIETTSHDPFFNQAFEDYVFRTFREDEVLLLWRNRPAVVVGCYQNICREVHVRALLEQNIPVVRRMSGGGTVYHDLGNLNYTLITGQSGALDYDRCLAPVLRALNALGVPAQKSRTCDMTVDGKKISGSAQKIANGRVLHHGTLLFDADLTRLDEITTGRKNDAFCSKGTQSAICAVTNLRPYLREDCEIVTFARQLAQRILPPGAKTVRLTQAQLADVRRLAADLYQSWDWTWGKTPAFTYEKTAEFVGRPICVRYEARHGLIRNAAVQSRSTPRAHPRCSKAHGWTRRCFWTFAGRSRASGRRNCSIFLCKPNGGKTMEKQLVMPKLQPEMQSGVLCAWLKNEGEEIHKGEALYEIETDKVVNQIEATEDGILRRQLCEEGDSVAVLTPVAIIET